MARRYNEDGLSTTKIGELCNCSANTVANYLRKHGIEVRPFRKPKAVQDDPPSAAAGQGGWPAFSEGAGGMNGDAGRPASQAAPRVITRRRGDQVVAIRRDGRGRHRVTVIGPWLADLIEGP